MQRLPVARRGGELASIDPFWDKIAAKYEASSAGNIGPNFAARVERAATLFGPRARVLDVGCASGEIPLALAKHVAAIHGIDVSPKLVEFARGKAKQRGIANASFESGDVIGASLAEESFDGITVFAVFHLVEDPAKLLHRLYTLLRPGGHMISETPCLADRSWIFGPIIKLAQWVGKAPRIVTRLHLTDVEEMIREAGFEILESKRYNSKNDQQSITARRPQGTSSNVS